MLYLKALNPHDARQQHAFFQEMHSENGFMNDYEHVSDEQEHYIRICV